MSYTVLARKFRSRTFDEVVGQGAITATLKSAITRDRVHHGYLFCGTRGVGKTSMARILAKALNCLASDGPTVDPCGECDSCVNIARGEDVDVVEIDAASNTGVDNIRELRSNAIYRPTRSRFKVYIIDEVHMLSTGAFNALLKTLEEPPGHVKFILATTESHKIPATVLSRVQRFDFKAISVGEIAGQLARICESEGVKVEDAAAKRLARLAAGSMRDALSLLDQVVSMSGDTVSADVVDELLPPAHDELLGQLIDRFAEGDAAGALAAMDQSLGQGHTLDHWCTLLIAQIRDLMVLRVCGADTDFVDAPSALRPRLVEQSKKFDSGAFVYMTTVLEELRRSVKTSGSGRALAEAAVIRLAEATNFSSIESLLSQVGGVAAASGVKPVAAGRSKKNGPAIASDAAAGRSAPAESVARTTDPAKKHVAPAVQAGSRSRVAPPPPAARRATRDDLEAARSQPTVKAALELFGGQIVEVRRASVESAPPVEENETS
jgi:DNA polymerase-3 subunit gamma/tau